MIRFLVNRDDSPGDKMPLAITSEQDRVALRGQIGIMAVLGFAVCSCAPHGPAHYRANGVYQSFDISSAATYRDYQDALRKDLTCLLYTSDAADE